MLKWNKISKNLKPLKESFHFDFKWFLPDFNKCFIIWNKFQKFDIEVNWDFLLFEFSQRSFYFDFKWRLPAFNKSCWHLKKASIIRC